MSEVATVHGTVARVIDVPSQSMSYLRIEVPIEFHAELTRQFYGKRVLVVPAGSTMDGQPYGIFNVADGGEKPAPTPSAPRAVIKAPERDGPPGGALSKSAAMIVATKAFQAFAWQCEAGHANVPSGFGSGDADVWLKVRCEIGSKAELDNDVAAAALFRDLMAEFRDWRADHPEYAE